MCLKDAKSTYHKDFCTLSLIAFLFTRAEKQNHASCLSADKWIKKNVLHTHNANCIQPQRRVKSYPGRKTDGLESHHITHISRLDRYTASSHIGTQTWGHEQEEGTLKKEGQERVANSISMTS